MRLLTSRGVPSDQQELPSLRALGATATAEGSVPPAAAHGFIPSDGSVLQGALEHLCVGHVTSDIPGGPETAVLLSTFVTIRLEGPGAVYDDRRLSACRHRLHFYSASGQGYGRGSAVEATGGALLLLGAVSMVAAIVGGNVSLPGGTTFGALTNTGLRATLGAFSIALLVTGGALMLGSGSSPPGPEPGPTVAPEPPSPEPLEPSPTTAGPSRTEFIAAAQGICAEGDRRRQSVPDPGESGTSQQQAAFLEEQQRVAQATNTGLRGLEVPTGDEAEIQALRQAHDGYVQLLGELAAIAASDDPSAIEAFDENKLGRVVQDFDVRARGYGLDDCVILPA